MKVIGIVGTAKNTGKTTALAYLLHNLKSKSVSVGVTGIGYDGEEIDNITLLPKPRLYLETGMVVTTSEKCLGNTSAHFEILSETEARTALGRVLIVRITKPGLMVIAGPNKMSSLKIIIERIRSFGVDTLFVDGSLNRISPMSVVDKIIFATGASRDTNIDFLVDEIALIEKVFRLPKTQTDYSSLNEITLIGSGKRVLLSFRSLIDTEDSRILIEAFSKKIQTVVIPGLVTCISLMSFVEYLIDNNCNNIELVVESPISLLFCEEHSKTSGLLNLCDKSGTMLSYIRRPELAGITVNPFYPNLKGSSYSAAYINKEKLYSKMLGRISTPVFNIKDSGAELLRQMVL